MAEGQTRRYEPRNTNNDQQVGAHGSSGAAALDEGPKQARKSRETPNQVEPRSEPPPVSEPVGAFEQELRDLEAQYAARLHKSQNKRDQIKQKPLKVVVIGDPEIGKTSLISQYIDGKPTAGFNRSETHKTEVRVADHDFELSICEPAKTTDYTERLRPLSYIGVHACLVCFSIASPGSFENIEEKWIPEFRRFMPHVPVVLVGCQLDLRDDPTTIENLKRWKGSPVSLSQAGALSKKVKAVHYVECDNITGAGVNEIFRVAAVRGLGMWLLEDKPKRFHHRCIIA